MPRQPANRLRYLHIFLDRHGKTRTYYRRSGRKLPIHGEPWSAEWLDAYNEIHKAFSAKPKRPAAGLPAPEDDFAAAARSYLASAKFSRLSDSAKKGYRREIEKLVASIGHHKLKNFTRGQIVQIRDRIAEKTPRRAKEIVLVIKLILDRAHDLDMIDRNPAKGIDPPANHRAKPYRPWTEEEIDRFLAHARPAPRRALMVLLHTGLRVGDGAAVRRTDIKNGRLYWTETKTKTPVVIPISQDLAVELSTPLPVEGMTLICGHQGRPMDRNSAAHLIRKEARRIGIVNPAPVHGLRKNAVQHLVEVGCTEQEISAITGQSPAIIRHYAKGYNRDRLVDAVVIKMDVKK